MVLVTLFHLRDCDVLHWDRAGKDRAGLHCDRVGEQCEVDVLVEVVGDQRGRHAEMQLEVEAPCIHPCGYTPLNLPRHKIALPKPAPLITQREVKCCGLLE